MSTDATPLQMADLLPLPAAEPTYLWVWVGVTLLMFLLIAVMWLRKRMQSSSKKILKQLQAQQLSPRDALHALAASHPKTPLSAQIDTLRFARPAPSIESAESMIREVMKRG